MKYQRLYCSEKPLALHLHAKSHIWDVSKMCITANREDMKICKLSEGLVKQFS